MDFMNSSRLPDLLAAMMTRALDSDVGATRLLLERAVATLKAAEQPQARQHQDGKTSLDVAFE